MPAFTASAPGKIILFGEHAVVYGQPAIAVPVRQVQARAVVRALPGAQAGSVHIQAPAVQLDAQLDTLPPEHALSAVVAETLKELRLERLPACSIRITSTIPVAAGLGSGAAVSVALIRALCGFVGRPLSDERISAVAYEVEKIYHGTPSGIDNTVITYARPVYFVRDQTLQTLELPAPFTLLIADTGIPSPTSIAVGDVRRLWQVQSGLYNELFEAIGGVVRAARRALEHGQPAMLGPLMDANQALLRQLTVSSPELDHLVSTALQAGALGAKLSGGGRGGNMVALVDEIHASAVSAALLDAGAANVILTQVST